MECQDCVDTVSKILSEIKGINSFKVSLENQSVLVEGTVAPSRITHALRDSGRAAILRGSGDSGDGLGILSLPAFWNKIANFSFFFFRRCRVYSGYASTGQSSSGCSWIGAHGAITIIPTPDVR